MGWFDSKVVKKHTVQVTVYAEDAEGALIAAKALENIAGHWKDPNKLQRLAEECDKVGVRTAINARL